LTSPLGLYVHWPYCARICPYCDFNVVRDRGRKIEQAQLVEAILTDMRTQADLTGPRPLVSIFFGGGTPSLMEPDAVARIIAQAKILWPSQGALEISLEANPTDAERERFEGFAKAGVERLSLGLQSLDDASLKLLGRNHGADEALRAARTARDIFARLSVDLIYALPEQSPQAWAVELAAAADLGADHISPYQLTIENGTAFDRAVRRGALVPPDDELGAVLYETTQTVLSQRGFDAYEVSNHAKGQAACSRHNLIYWRGEDYVGVGPGAHGRITVEGQRVATFAAPKIGDYRDQVEATGLGWESEQVLSPQEQAEERLLAGLRINEGVSFNDLVALDLTPDHHRVAQLTQLGLITTHGNRLCATPQGRTLLDAVTSVLAG
jgi:putative oxygen-independent coproporphyrinogen III oxidase